MPTFEIRYRPDATQPLKNLRRARNSVLGALITFSVFAVVLIAFSIFQFLVTPQLPPLLLILAIPLAAAIGVLAMNLRLFSGRRTSPPPVALRLSSDGVTIWPVVGVDCFLPWACVKDIHASHRGIAVHVHPGTGPDTPGAIGLADPTTQTFLRKPERFYTEGFNWQSWQDVDVDELEAATRGFSGGGVALVRQ